MIKLVLSDIDGTLADSHQRIPETFTQIYQ